MIPISAPPELNPLVDAVFDSLPEPEGFEFDLHEHHYLWPVFGQDSWRLIMVNKETKEKVPVFLAGNVIRFLTNALKTVNEEIVKAVPPSLTS
jgi:hypothetical protein